MAGLRISTFSQIRFLPKRKPAEPGAWPGAQAGPGRRRQPESLAGGCGGGALPSPSHPAGTSGLSRAPSGGRTGRLGKDTAHVLLSPGGFRVPQPRPLRGSAHCYPVGCEASAPERRGWKGVLTARQAPGVPFVLAPLTSRPRSVGTAQKNSVESQGWQPASSWHCPAGCKRADASRAAPSWPPSHSAGETRGSPGNWQPQGGGGGASPRASEAWPSQEWRRQPLLRDGKMGLKLRRERQRSWKQVCTNTQESSRGKAEGRLEGTIVPRQWGLCLPPETPRLPHLPLMENTSFQENLKSHG